MNQHCSGCCDAVPRWEERESRSNDLMSAFAGRGHGCRSGLGSFVTCCRAWNCTDHCGKAGDIGHPDRLRDVADLSASPEGRCNHAAGSGLTFKS